MSLSHLAAQWCTKSCALALPLPVRSTMSRHCRSPSWCACIAWQRSLLPWQHQQLCCLRSPAPLSLPPCNLRLLLACNSRPTAL